MIDVLSARCWVITWDNTFPTYMRGPEDGPRPFPELPGKKAKVYTLAEAKARIAELEGPKRQYYPSTKFALDCDIDLVTE